VRLGQQGAGLGLVDAQGQAGPGHPLLDAAGALVVAPVRHARQALVCKPVRFMCREERNKLAADILNFIPEKPDLTYKSQL